MSLFDFILAFLLAFNPGISDEDFNNVYSILDDTSIHSIIVEDSAFDKLSQLAGADVMPLDLTSTESGYLLAIMRALYAGGNPNNSSLFSTLHNDLLYDGYTAARYLYFIDNKIGSVSGYTVSSLLKNTYDEIVAIYKELNNSTLNGRSTIYGLLTSLNTNVKDFSSQSAGGWSDSISEPFQWYDVATSTYIDSDMRPIQVLSYLRGDLDRNLYGPVGFRYLNSNGNESNLTSNHGYLRVIASSLLGLSANLSGRDKRTTFTFLAEDITQASEEVTADNLLDALGIMGTQLQNPLQRLAYVFANPEDLEIRENVSENQEAANENFFKPGSTGSVKPSDIGEAAGFVSGAGDLLQAGGSPGDAFAQLGQGSDNWGFFSQAAMDDMLGSPPPSTQADDFGELGEDGLYHLLPSHLFEVDSMLGKGG